MVGSATSSSVAADPSGRLVTDGGRVLDVTALAPDLASARRRAYEAVDLVRWPGRYVRTDIAAAAAAASASVVGPLHEPVHRGSPGIDTSHEGAK